MRRFKLLSALLLATSATALLPLGCATPEPATSHDVGPPEPVVEYVSRQEILTPLPIRVRLPERYRAERVLVFVRTWGSRDWSVLELGRHGQTWAGAVSCREVSTVTGDTRYFFLALDHAGNTVVGSGSAEWPHVVTVVGSLEGGVRALSGEMTPIKCHDPADCPPDFKGCPVYTFVRPSCSRDDDCADGKYCAWDGYCGPASTENVEVEVHNDLDDQQLLARAVQRATAIYKKAGASKQ